MLVWKASSRRLKTLFVIGTLADFLYQRDVLTSRHNTILFIPLLQTPSRTWYNSQNTYRAQISCPLKLTILIGIRCTYGYCSVVTPKYRLRFSLFSRLWGHAPHFHLLQHGNLGKLRQKTLQSKITKQRSGERRVCKICLSFLHSPFSKSCYGITKSQKQTTASLTPLPTQN